ncbi:MAG: hypothetical protein A3Q59_03720 [Methanomethylophilus alvi]|nr:MAG: hypothetical protein A3Q59_03720 [Methanomethylophilus alvi]
MKSATIALIAAAAVIAAGAGAAFVLLENDSDEKKDTVAVTMSWEKDIAGEIVGDRYEVVSMMGSNVSPHEAYSTPSNISDLYKSEIYFKIGTGVEWETAFFDAVSKDIPSSVKIVSIADGIEYTALPNGHHHHGEEEQADSASDPHIWTSPDNLRKIAEFMAAEISKLDPDNASDYSENLGKYLAKVDAVDAEMESLAKVAGSGHVHVMVWHPAWKYLLEQYAERFGTDFHMISVEEDGEVTPAEAAAIVKDEGCSAIYVSVTDEGYEGRQALEDAGITVHVVNPTADDMLSSVSEFLSYLRGDLGGTA